MIKSMTGFGKGTEKCPYGEITAEVKTLNHKSLSISCTPFEGFFLLEDKIKALFEGRVFRGKVFVRISRENVDKQKPLKKMVFNEDLAKEYIRKIRSARKRLSVKGDLEITDVIAFPGVIEYGGEKIEQKLWPYIKKAAQKAIDKLVEYRRHEGTRIAKDLKQGVQRIQKELDSIKKFSKKSVEEYRNKLTKTVSEISEEMELDRGRLETEVALFAKNCDISEEMARTGHHLAAYKAALVKSKEDAGKKLDFIAQEMHREANTMTAKSNDFRIIRSVIEIKSQVEKMREQLKNIE